MYVWTGTWAEVRRKSATNDPLCAWILNPGILGIARNHPLKLHSPPCHRPHGDGLVPQEEKRTRSNPWQIKGKWQKKRNWNRVCVYNKPSLLLCGFKCHASPVVVWLGEEVVVLEISSMEAYTFHTFPEEGRQNNIVTRGREREKKSDGGDTKRPEEQQLHSFSECKQTIWLISILHIRPQHNSLVTKYKNVSHILLSMVVSKPNKWRTKNEQMFVHGKYRAEDECRICKRIDI